MFQPKANYNKLKTNLRLSINRLKLMEKKKTEMALKARKEIADYISAGKDDRARIRVEHIIREDYLVEAMELIEMYCDLLLARFGLIQSQKELDAGIEEAVASILWVTPRLMSDIDELKAVSEQLSIKYSKEFTQACLANTMKNVNEKVMHKLSVQAPPKMLVERYLIEIAKSYNVPFEPDQAVMCQNESMLGDLIDVEAGFCSSKCPEPNPTMQFPYTPPMPPMMCNPYPPPPPSQPPNLGLPYPAQNLGGLSYPNSGSNSVASNNGLEPPPAYTSMRGGGESGGAFGEAIPPKNATLLNLPELPNVPNSPSASYNTAGSGASAPPGTASEDIDFDDLSRRFDELKRRK